MPELPEVHTTATILNKLVKGKKIKSVWTDYKSAYYKGKENIKDPKYFNMFAKEVSNKKVVRVWRRAKNVLIDIGGDKTILIHMKMTGHLLYGTYAPKKVGGKIKWFAKEKALQDPFSRFIHLVFELSDGKHIAFSDMRKFATVKLISDKEALEKEFEKAGPEPLDKSFDWKKFRERLQKKPNGKIKTVLMDVTVLSGIGNIYSDEILWASKIHPEQAVSKLKDVDFKNMHKHMKILLSKGIDLGGDSMSDYRNPYGKKGKFQLHHKAYRRTGEKCLRRGCEGIMKRTVVNTRSAHYCPTCQKI